MINERSNNEHKQWAIIQDVPFNQTNAKIHIQVSRIQVKTKQKTAGHSIAQPRLTTDRP
jgi:hypothetical protein